MTALTGLHARLSELGATVGVAESLTGGLRAEVRTGGRAGLPGAAQVGMRPAILTVVPFAESGLQPARRSHVALAR